MTNLEGLVKFLDVQISMPLLLSGYRCLNIGDFEKLTRNVIAHYMRYGLVTNRNPLDMESAFYEASRAIRDAKKNNESSAKTLTKANKS